MNLYRDCHRFGGTFVLLLVLVTLTGCLGAAGPGSSPPDTTATSDVESITPTPTPTQTTAEPTQPATVERPFAPETAPERLDATTDWDHRKETHRTVVRNGSGASFVYSEATRDGPRTASTSYSQSLKFAQTTDVESGTMFRKNSYGPDGPIETIEYYNEPGTLHAHAIHHAGGKTYEDIEHVPVKEESSAELATPTDQWAWDGRTVFDAIDDVTWEYVTHETRNDGQQVAIYEATNMATRDDRNVVEGQLQIADTGVVMAASIVTFDPQTERLSRTEFSLTLGPQDVPEPEWTERAGGRHVIESDGG